VSFLFLNSVSAFATFKAGQVYKLKRAIAFVKEPTLESTEPHEGSAHFSTLWSLKDKKFAKATQLAPGLCELTVVQKSANTNTVMYEKGAKFKVSTPISSEDAHLKSTLKNCLVMDALSEETGAKEKPQIQFQCCSEKDLPTAASRQEFNEEIQEKLKPLWKLFSDSGSL
jgi:hypothetical protein